MKELRLAGVSTMEVGNAFLPSFMADYNARFAKAPFNDKDLNGPMTPRDRLDEAITWRAERTLSQSLTLQYDNILFMIELSEFAQAAIGKRVEIVDFPDGRLEVRYKGRSMPYRTFDKLRRVTETAVLENKRLGGLLALIRQSQEAEPSGQRTRKGRGDATRPTTCSASADDATCSRACRRARSQRSEGPTFVRRPGGRSLRSVKAARPPFGRPQVPCPDISIWRPTRHL